MAEKKGNVTIVTKDTPDETSYDAFCYQYERQDTGRKYVGYHKGNVDDGYTHSSTNKDLADDLRNLSLSFTYEAIAFGTTDEMLDFEKKILTNSDAAGSSDWYNRHNGFGSGNMSTDPDEIQELVDRIESGEWNLDETKSVDILTSLPRVQVRDMDNSALENLLSEKFRDNNGMITEHVNPVILLEGRGVNGEDKVLNGNTTIGGAKKSKVVPELPVITIPYKVHSLLSELQLQWAGTILNKQGEYIAEPVSHEDLLKQILGECSTEEEAGSQNTRKLLKLTGKTTGQITKAINEAKAKIREKDFAARNRLLIDWEASQYSKILQDKAVGSNVIVEDEPDKSTYAHVIASGFVSVSKVFQPMLNACLDLDTGKLTRTNLKVFIWHNLKKRNMKEEWDKTSAKTKKYLYWTAKKFGITLTIVEMPITEDALI